MAAHGAAVNSGCRLSANASSAPVGALGKFARAPAISACSQHAKAGAGEGNRTLVFSLEGCCSTIELHPPGTPRAEGLCHRTRRSVNGQLPAAFSKMMPDAMIEATTSRISTTMNPWPSLRSAIARSFK